jgi:hypothetical protein
MKKLFYRVGLAAVVVLCIAGATPFSAFADTPGATSEQTAPVSDEPASDDYDGTVYEYDPDAPWLYYDMTEEEYYEEFEPWRITGQTEEEYWDEYWDEYDERMRVSFLNDYGFTDTDISNIAVNGQALNFDEAKPVVRGGAIMIPARAVLEALGADVSYDGKSKTMTADVGDARAVFTMGDQTALVTRNDLTTETELAAAPFIDGATASAYVPLRALAEGLGFEVYWDDYFKLAEVVDKKALVAEIDAKFTVFNAMIRGELDSYAVGGNSEKAERTDINLKAQLSARYDPDYSYYSYYEDDGPSNVTESNTKAEGKIKIISDGNGVDATGNISVEISGFEDILGDIDQDAELKAVFDDLKKGVPFDVIINYADAAAYLHLPILSHIDPLLNNDTWIISQLEDYESYIDLQTDRMIDAMEESFIEGDGDITLGNLFYMKAFEQSYSYYSGLNRIEYLRAAVRLLEPFLGDLYMEKNGDVYTISLNRLELFNIFRRLSNDEDIYIGGYDYAEMLADIPVANYKLEIKEKNGAPVSVEIAVNAKFKTESYYYSEDGYVEFHYGLASELEARNVSVDFSIAAENLDGIESGEFSVHVDAVSAPTNETPRAKPPAGVRTVPVSDIIDY